MVRTAFAAIAVLLATAPAAAETRLPTTGGGGGGPFETMCPAGSFLRGVELRGGDDVDAIRPICGGDGRPDQAIDPWRGGDGGTLQALLCPANAPIVHGMSVQAEGVATYIVNAVALWCGNSDASMRPGDTNLPDARWAGPKVQGRDFPTARFAAVGNPQQHFCPPGEVGGGVHGRHGIWLDALGLACVAASRMSERTGKALGRRRDLGPPAPPSPPLTAIQICQLARDVQSNPNRSQVVKLVLINRCLDAYPGGALNSGNVCVQAKLIRDGRLPGDFAAKLKQCFDSLPR